MSNTYQTIPEKIEEIERDLQRANEALSLPGVSYDTRKVIESMRLDAERELRVLRREFDYNKKALDAAGISG